jgi:hypothetical protein
MIGEDSIKLPKIPDGYITGYNFSEIVLFTGKIAKGKNKKHN